VLQFSARAEINKLPPGFGGLPELQKLIHEKSPGSCTAVNSLLSNPQGVIKAGRIVRQNLNFIFEQTTGTEKKIAPWEKQLVSFLHWQSHCYLNSIQEKTINNRLSWKELSMLLSSSSKDSRGKALSPELTLIWIDVLQKQGQGLSTILDIPPVPNPIENLQTRPYIVFQNSLLTPGQASMWLHCQLRLNVKAKQWQAVLESGFESPAFQFLLFTKSAMNIQEALKAYFLPGYRGHSLAIPAIRVKLVSDSEADQSPPWELLYDTCSEYGFSPTNPGSEMMRGELSFRGIEEMYDEVFLNTLIPQNIARDLPPALKATGFYPSPQGLKIILALSAQESTMQWNPKLNLQKKRYLKERFHHLLGKLRSSVPGSVSTLFLSEEHQNQVDQLFLELNKLTDTGSNNVREYDFYLWSRKALHLIDKLCGEYQKMTRIGQWFFDLQTLKQKLEFEPQTFGLWQINVNHLKEKIESYHQLRRAYPDIYLKSNGNWRVNRSWLIDALSGVPHARLNRRRTLELIIHTHLRPRYENHLLGDEEDLLFFAAENMSGEMSTFRAAVQEELNNKMNSHLETDGDLTYYLPYSLKIDWRKPSQTYRVLKEFIGRHQYYFSSPLLPEERVVEVCRAGFWGDLKNLELYIKLMGKKSGIRVFPGIKSALYDQTPLDYAKLVRKKSMLF
jgi:hypothetical protein